MVLLGWPVNAASETRTLSGLSGVSLAISQGEKHKLWGALNSAAATYRGIQRIVHSCGVTGRVITGLALHLWIIFPLTLETLICCDPQVSGQHGGGSGPGE